jgi:hypothetical protein
MKKLLGLAEESLDRDIKIEPTAKNLDDEIKLLVNELIPFPEEGFPVEDASPPAENVSPPVEGASLFSEYDSLFVEDNSPPEQRPDDDNANHMAVREVVREAMNSDVYDGEIVSKAVSDADDFYKNNNSKGSNYDMYIRSYNKYREYEKLYQEQPNKMFPCYKYHFYKTLFNHYSGCRGN